MEGPVGGARPPGGPHPGLCADCRHARPVTSSRGSTFWRCALSDTSANFPKYPRLPVITCLGFDKLSATERERPRD